MQMDAWKGCVTDSNNQFHRNYFTKTIVSSATLLSFSFAWQQELLAHADLTENGFFGLFDLFQIIYSHYGYLHVCPVCYIIFKDYYCNYKQASSKHILMVLLWILQKKCLTVVKESFVIVIKTRVGIFLFINATAEAWFRFLVTILNKQCPSVCLFLMSARLQY